MGLAAPKKKTKLSYDPNNTRWINNTQSFGHKILTSQGWKKGEFLGAKNAAHSEFHTAANSSHIRVALKDNNLGLGAKIGTGVGHGECTGLDAFKNLLGRLNGKTETQIAQEQKVRVDIRRSIYTEKRWGSMNFVSGGYLVGDKIQNLMNPQNKRKRDVADKDDAASKKLEQCKSKSKASLKDDKCGASKKSKKSKKRKANIINEDDIDSNYSKSNKKQKIHQDSKDSNDLSLLNNIDDTKSKKTSSSKKAYETEHDDTNKKDKQKKKKKKMKMKMKKEGLESVVEKDEKLYKEKKNSKRGKIHSESLTVNDSCLSSFNICTEGSPPNENSKYENPILLRGRHAIRARNIAQKKLSGMDMASLNQASQSFTQF